MKTKSKKNKTKQIKNKTTKAKKPTQSKAKTTLVKFGENTVLKHNSDIFYRETGDNEISILNANLYDTYYKLDNWAAQLWKLFDGKTSLIKHVQTIAKKSGMTQAEVMTEAKKIISSLLSEKLLIVFKK